MQVEELYDLTSWIQTEIVDEIIIKKYQQLHAVLEQNSQPNQQKQSFEDQKEALVTALNNVALDELSIGQLEVLSTIGITTHIGQEGVEKLEDVLFRNAIDTATAAQHIQQSMQQINEGIQWSKQIHDLVSKIISVEEVDEIGDSVLLRVHFSGDAHMSNLTEFKDWGKVWWDIGRGIAMAHNGAPEDIQVVGASKGSVIISLLTAYGIAKTTSGIIMEGLKVAEKVLDIKKQIQVIRAMELSNDAAEKALEEDAKNEKISGIDKIVQDSMNTLEIERDGDGERANALESSIKKLVDFVEMGGEVDFVIPDDDDENEDAEEAAADENKQEREALRVIFKEVRRLEKKVHQLEHKED